MNYIYIPGFPHYPIWDKADALSCYEHIGKEIDGTMLTFIGKVNGLLHRLQLQPMSEAPGQIVYHPTLIPLKSGEVVDVATAADTIVLANGP